MPFVMVTANYFFFHEKIRAKVTWSLVLGFVGVAILLSAFIQEMEDSNFLVGILLTLLSVVTWTSGTLISTRSNYNTNPYEGIGWQMLFGGCILLALSFLTGQRVPITEIPWQAWGYFLYLVMIGSIFCFLSYLYALKKLPISLVSIYVYINPIVALLLGVLFLHEKISARLLLGVTITFIGIYFVKKFTAVKPTLEDTNI